jgi:hypothetical protein
MGNMNSQPTLLSARPTFEVEGNLPNDQCEPPSPDEPRMVTPRRPSAISAASIFATCAVERYMQTCRCDCRKASHSGSVTSPPLDACERRERGGSRPCPMHMGSRPPLASEQSRSHEAAESEPSDIESTCARRGRRVVTHVVAAL